MVTSIVTLDTEYNITINASSCFPADTGSSSQTFTSQFGCDSIVTTITALLPGDVITINDIIKGSRELQGALSGYGEDTSKAALNAMYRASMSNEVARLLIIDAYDGEKRLKIPEEAIDERASLIVAELDLSELSAADPSGWNLGADRRADL